MIYKIKIEKVLKNEDYEKELKEYRENSRYSNSTDRNHPEKEIIIDVLQVELLEIEYKKVKAEVIKIFE